MSSFGGETPVAVVTAVIDNFSGTYYTVPSGKYFKGVLLIEPTSGGDLRISSVTISPLTSGTALEKQIIMHSGQTLSLNGTSGSGSIGYLNGVLYNNPS